MAGIITATTTDTPEQARAALEHYGMEAEVESTPLSADAESVQATTKQGGGKQETPAPAAAEPVKGEEGGEPSKTAGDSETLDDNVEQEIIDGKRDEEFKGQRRLLRRIDRRTRSLGEERENRKQLESEIGNLKRELEELKDSSGKQEPSAPAEDAREEADTEEAAADAKRPPRPKAPRQRDYAEWDDYEKALDEHDANLDKYEENLAAWLKRQAAREVSREQEREAVALEEQRRNEQWNAAGARFPDYQQKIQESAKSVTISKAMEVVCKMMDPEVGTLIAYHMGDDPEFISELAEATMAASEAEWAPALKLAKFELAKFAKRFQKPGEGKTEEPKPAAPAAPPPAPAPKKETRKAEPITPVASRVSPAAGGLPDKTVGTDGFTLKDYAASRIRK